MSLIYDYINDNYCDKKNFKDRLFSILLNAEPILFKEDFLLETLELNLILEEYQPYFKTKFLLANCIWEYLLFESSQQVGNSLSNFEMNRIWDNQDINQVRQLFLKINIKSREIQVSEFINYLCSLDNKFWNLLLELITDFFREKIEETININSNNNIQSNNIITNITKNDNSTKTDNNHKNNNQTDNIIKNDEDYNDNLKNDKSQYDNQEDKNNETSIINKIDKNQFDKKINLVKKSKPNIFKRIFKYVKKIFGYV